jgi:uncharacterized RDD family membrane protein YckC
MVTQELLTFVRVQSGQGIGRDAIQAGLIGQGWLVEDVQEAFASLGTGVSPVLAPSGPIIVQAATQVSTATAPSEDVSYAGFWQRAFAGVIDAVILTLVLWAAVILSFIIAKGPASPIVAPVIALLSILYYVVLESGSRQATFGKMLMGIKVTNLEGVKISIARSFGRSLSKVLLSPIAAIDFIVCTFSSKKQALHDMIAGTLVLRSRESNAVRTILVFILSIILLGGVCGYVGYTMVYPKVKASITGGFLKFMMNASSDIQGAESFEKMNGTSTAPDVLEASVSTSTSADSINRADPSANASDPLLAEKDAIIKGFLKTKEIFLSKDVSKLRAYLSAIPSGAPGKQTQLEKMSADIKTMSDDEISAILGFIGFAYEGFDEATLTSDRVTWEVISPTEVKVKLSSKTENSSMSSSVGVSKFNGVWY